MTYFEVLFQIAKILGALGGSLFFAWLATVWVLNHYHWMDQEDHDDH